jgi:hypothetical protein
MKVKTIGPVQHDGKDVELGATLNLSAKAAKQLVDAGAAELVGTDKAADSIPAPDGGQAPAGTGDNGGAAQ